MSDDIITLASLPAKKPHRRTWEPSAEQRGAMAAQLGITELRKLRVELTLTPQGKSDWRLEARWGATVVQPCVVTLAPVVTRLEETSTLTYTAKMPEITDSEAEMPEDDTLEALPEEIQLSSTVAEMIALSLPDYPRAEGVEIGEQVFGPPGQAPMTDEDAKPFAGLASLKEKLEKGGS
ncbi:MAG: DUF177 domain-containing protein [Pseudomonadota bacterium]